MRCPVREYTLLGYVTAIGVVTTYLRAMPVRGRLKHRIQRFIKVQTVTTEKSTWKLAVVWVCLLFLGIT